MTFDKPMKRKDEKLLIDDFDPAFMVKKKTKPSI